MEVMRKGHISQAKQVRLVEHVIVGMAALWEFSATERCYIFTVESDNRPR